MKDLTPADKADIKEINEFWFTPPKTLKPEMDSK